jgi:hypothetical protein
MMTTTNEIAYHIKIIGIETPLVLPCADVKNSKGSGLTNRLALSWMLDEPAQHRSPTSCSGASGSRTRLLALAAADQRTSMRSTSPHTFV